MKDSFSPGKKATEDNTVLSAYNFAMNNLEQDLSYNLNTKVKTRHRTCPSYFMRNFVLI